MSRVNHTLIVQSDRPPVVEFDPEAGAVYVRFSQRKVAKTLEGAGDGMIVTVDLDRDGGVIGIEGVCFDEFSIAQLLKAANVRAGRIDFSKARFRAPSRQVERALVET